MVSKKDFEKMLTALEERSEKRLAALGDNLNLKFETVIKKLDTHTELLNGLAERTSLLEGRVDVVESSLNTIENTHIPDLQRLSTCLRDSVTSLQLSLRMNNLIVSNVNISATALTYQNLLSSLAAHSETAPRPLTSYPLRNKDGNCIGLLIKFQSAIDRNIMTDLISKKGKAYGIIYREDLPAELTALKNKLLIERRQLLTAGTGCFIRTSLRPPFLSLIQIRSPKKATN